MYAGIFLGACVITVGIVGLYPYRLKKEGKMDEIPTKTKQGVMKSWYVTHAKHKLSYSGNG